MDGDAPPGLGSSVSLVGPDLGVLRELLQQQSEQISTAGKGNLMKLQRKWEECLDRVEAKVFAQDEVVQKLSMRCCILEDKLQQWFEDRHGLGTESETKVDLVQTKRRKGRRKRNKAAVGNEIECEQQVLVDSVDDVCGTPGNIDVAKDHTMVGVLVLCQKLASRIGLAMLLRLTIWMARA